MKRPSVESIVETIKDAYAATGRTPCCGVWEKGTKECCPGVALELARGEPDAGADPAKLLGNACKRVRELLGGGPEIVNAFLRGFDGQEPEERNGLYVPTERYRPFTDTEYADYLWAFHVGKRVAQELGVAAA